MANKLLSKRSFAIRMVAAFLLVFSTYNPSGFSYSHWVMQAGLTPSVALVGMLFVAGWVIYLAATYHSLGIFGTIILTLLLLVFFWWLYDMGLLSVNSGNTMIYLGLFAISIVLGAGLTWSYIWRMITGQVTALSGDIGHH